MGRMKRDERMEERGTARRKRVHHSWTPGNSETRWVINLMTYQYSNWFQTLLPTGESQPEKSHKDDIWDTSSFPFEQKQSPGDVLSKGKCLSWDLDIRKRQDFTRGRKKTGHGHTHCFFPICIAHGAKHRSKYHFIIPQIPVFKHKVKV